MSNNLPNQKSWDHFWSKDYQKTDASKSWAKRRIEKVLRLCDLPQGMVVDAGCGSGYFSKMFCDWGKETVALDYSPQALEIARQLTQGKVQTVQADFVHDDLLHKFPQKNVSCIFSDGLFEHFEFSDQGRILKNFHSVLKENGFLITFVPNKWSPWQLIRPFFMPGIVEKPFILKELRKMHERNHFEVMVSGGINVLPCSFSPEFLGPYCGMLLYVIAQKRNESV